MVNLKTEKIDHKPESVDGEADDNLEDEEEEKEIKTRSGKKIANNKRIPGTKRSREDRSSDEFQNEDSTRETGESSNDESQDEEEEEEDEDTEYAKFQVKVGDASNGHDNQRRSSRAKKARFDVYKSKSWILSSPTKRSERLRSTRDKDKPYLIRKTRHSHSSARKSYREDDGSSDDEDDDDDDELGEEEEDDEDEDEEEQQQQQQEEEDMDESTQEEEDDDNVERENQDDEEGEQQESREKTTRTRTSSNSNQSAQISQRKSTRNNKSIEENNIVPKEEENSSQQQHDDVSNEELGLLSGLSPSLRVTRQQVKQITNTSQIKTTTNSNDNCTSSSSRTPNRGRNTNNSRSSEFDQLITNDSPVTTGRYSTRQRDKTNHRHHHNSEDTVPAEDAELENSGSSESQQNRRSQRVRKSSLENHHDEEQPENDGDMYTRLKRRSRTSRNFCEKQSNNRKEPIEPISRRLRERKVTQDPSATRPSLIENLLAKDRKRRHRRNKRRHSSSSDNSDSSDSSRGSMNRDPSRGNRPRQSPYEKPEKVGSKKGFMDIQPIQVDPSITFESVGGLDHIIEKLREIVVLPLVYKDFYADRNIIPPRGILFHGPPGTGKTLLARALSNECADVGGRKVSFFVRKGADLLNKWVGESERHLRQLFEQASRCQPSIIFFDEIDGLAPARSSKTDQVHNSIVSTLLAELDGVKDRGDIIIVGATNRIDSLDPALRRPGRFDHEFAFLLPAKSGRAQIIQSHVSKWKGEEVSKNVVEEIAKRCVGFSGADLKLLCAEASMCALRRRYPQIYLSKQKYLLDYNSIKVGPSDWYNAMKKVNRSSDRSLSSIIACSKPLPKSVAPLLKNQVDDIALNLKKLYALNQDDSLMREPAPKRFLIYTRPGHEDNGVDQYIVPAVLHIFECIPVFTLSLESFSLQDTTEDCKTIVQVFAEAARVNKFAIVLIPSLNVILKMISEQSQEVLYQRMMTTEKPILVLATAQPHSEDLSDNIVNFFNGFSHEVRPTPRDCRKAFLRPIFGSDSLRVRVPVVKEEKALEEIPLAPPPPPKALSEQELKYVEKKETCMLRSLRKFLREILAKLARNKKYDDFCRPVDRNEVKDYYDIIQDPMNFETMMTKLNDGKYHSAHEFLDDIHLIRDNAVSYNPSTTFEGKSIIHRAHELVDYAHLVIEDEMDSDFEDACLAIIDARKERERVSEELRQYNATTTTTNSNNTERMSKRKPSSDSNEGNSSKNMDDTITPDGRKKFRGRRRHASTRGSKSTNNVEGNQTSDTNCNGIIESGDEQYEDSLSTNDFGSNVNHEMETITINSDTEGDDSFSNEFSEGLKKFVKCHNMEEYQKPLDELLNEALNVSKDMGVLRLLDFRYQLLFAVETNYELQDKKKLLTQWKQVIKHFSNAYKNYPRKDNLADSEVA